jgi:hypothetical protein
MIELRPMEDGEFVAWLPLLRDDYSGDLVRDFGMSPDQALAQAGVEIEADRPAGHCVFVIEVKGEPVGHLWLAERRDSYEPALVVYEPPTPFREAPRGPRSGRTSLLLS